MAKKTPRLSRLSTRERALFGLLIIATRPGVGLLPALSFLTWLSLAIVFAALIGAHIVIARQLMHIGNGGGPTEV